MSIQIRPWNDRHAVAPIAFADEETLEPLRGADDEPCGRIVRRRWSLHGAITVQCEPVEGHSNLRKVRVRIENGSKVVPGERSSALRTAFVSTHTLLFAGAGAFLSALDPPQAIAETPVPLVNKHTWPVLVGDEGAGAQRSPLVLSSPIILYDFPAVAPQSEGDTFDATEVDELMMLSVLSLSDEERRSTRDGSACAERAERFGPEVGSACTGRCSIRSTIRRECRDPFAALDVPGMDCIFVDGAKVSKDRQCGCI